MICIIKSIQSIRVKYLELRGSGQIGGMNKCPRLLSSPYELIKKH